MADAQVLLAREDGVATITLNRPERRNAMTEEMADGFSAAVGEVVGDPEVAVVVVRGAGADFCVGADLALLDRPPRVERDRGEQIALMRERTRTVELLGETPQTTIAAVSGGCAGAGLGWALATDLRLASESAVFRVAFRAARRPGDYGTIWALTRLLGSARARELCLLDRRVDAATALAIGLVSAVWPVAEFDRRLAETAAELAAAPREAMIGMERNLDDALTVDLSTALDRECERHVDVTLAR
jgi:2-(1,2-epoxy-1,2-dihydrophenyl)acetyl-CoA isomerase